MTPGSQNKGTFYILFLRKMKKFSFLLAGVFLLWTMAFVLADENKAEQLTEYVVPEPTVTTVDSLNTTDTATPENTWSVVDSAETTDTTTEETGTLADSTEDTTWDAIDTASKTDEETVEATEVETTGADTEAVSNDTDDSVTTTDSATQKYDEEQVKAYEWALEKWITTINDIEKAKLSDWLTRAQLAKMMSQYMTNVLWRTPAETEKVEYADVNESLGDLADFIQTAYAYKIMWINADGAPLKKFNPNGKVTRAEYATVFSRVLFGDKYNKSEWNYYEDHLNALKEAGILTNTTPTIQEIRGWVMLMMYRSNNTNTETSTEEPTIWMPNPASVYCEEQGWTVNIVKDEEWNESGMCKLADGTEVEEWEYYRANHQDETATTWDVAPLYSEEDLKAAEKVINDEGFGKMTVKVENIKLTYMGDEKANEELEYCKTFEEKEWLTIDECVVFESEFFVPEQEGIAGGLEANTTATGYQWYLGRTKGWEWKILTMGY